MIDDHQACKVDRPQGHFTLPQLLTTTQVCFNKYSLDGMFHFAKNSTRKVINSLFFLFLLEFHAALSLQENQSIHDIILARVIAKLISKILQASQ